MLQFRGTIPTNASSSTPVDDAYAVADIPSPLEVLVVSDVDALHHLGSYLASDLLDSYQALSTVTGIPLPDISTEINHILSRTTGSQGSQRQEDIPTPSIAPAATQAPIALAPATQDPVAPSLATKDPTTPPPT